MADVLIDAGVYSGFYSQAARSGIFWTSPTVGYVIFVDSDGDLVYRKTVDGGATWAAKNVIVTGFILHYDCWADWQTVGDSGTKIHIACLDSDSDNVIYAYLDTSDDSEGTDTIESCQGDGTFYLNTTRNYNDISITKARGGNLAVSFFYRDNSAAYFYEFYTSLDGDTWTEKTNPRENRYDHILLFPGNEADNQDVWAAYWDASTNEITLKTYDDSGNSWSEQLIQTLMNEHTEYLQMDGAIRFSDGHLFLAAWSAYDTATADLRVWEIRAAGSFTAKTNVLTNTDNAFLTSVFINQANDHIYVCYATGGNPGDLVKIYYKKSTDGAGTWGLQTTVQVNAQDNERWISCGAVKEAWGGKFLPVWFNDDLDDLFCNTDTGISTAVVPTTTILPATSIIPDEARINAEVLSDGGAACEGRFCWGEIVQEDDFEWGSDGDPLSDDGGGIDWTISAPGTSKAEIDTAVHYAGTRSARLFKDSDAVYAYFTQTALTSDQALEFRFRKDDAPYFALWHGNGTKYLRISVYAAEHIYYYDGAHKDTGYDVTVDTWQLFSIRNVDWDAGTFDIYFEGNLIKTGATMATSASYENQVRFINTVAGNIYLDNVRILANRTTTAFANGLTTDDPFYSDLTSLSTGTRHVYEAQLQNSVGEGLWSTEATFRTAFSKKSSFFNVL